MLPSESIVGMGVRYTGHESALSPDNCLFCDVYCLSSLGESSENLIQRIAFLRVLHYNIVQINKKSFIYTWLTWYLVINALSYIFKDSNLSFEHFAFLIEISSNQKYSFRLLTSLFFEFIPLFNQLQ